MIRRLGGVAPLWKRKSFPSSCQKYARRGLSTAEQQLPRAEPGAPRVPLPEALDSAAVVNAQKARRRWLRRVAFAALAPLAIPAAFVLNLKYDEEFKQYFDERYPEVVDLVRQYMDLNDPQPELDADGKEAFTFKDQNLYAHITTSSGKTYRALVSSQATAAALKDAIQLLGAAESEVIVDVQFEDSVEKTEKGEETLTPAAETPLPQGVEVVAAETEEERKAMSTWPEVRPVRPSKQIPPETKAQWELTSLRAKEAELKEELKSGGYREVDVIEEELRELEERKKQLKKVLKKGRSWF